MVELLYINLTLSYMLLSSLDFFENLIAAFVYICILVYAQTMVVEVEPTEIIIRNIPQALATMLALILI